MNTTQVNSELEYLKKLKRKTIKVYGPPGTGKTFTLIERILKKHLRLGTNAQDIAFISFTNKAVNTAKERAMEAFPDLSSEDFKKFSTLHSYCRKYFQEEIFDQRNCLIDFALQEKFLKTSDTRLADDDFLYKDWSLGIYDKARNMMRHPEDVFKEESYKKDNLEVFKRKISTYKKKKKDSFIDFTDMIERAIKEVSFGNLDILILDEAQDFTPLQWSVIFKIAKNANRVYLAGDDDQAIYRWNGADPKYFTDYFPGQKIVLRKTRRFGKAIYEFSQIIRRGIIDSIEKDFTPLDKEGTIKRYLNFNQINFKDEGSWYIIARVNRVVNELRGKAKDAGLYFMDNKGNKSFSEKQWKAIQSWHKISKGDEITKLEAENMYKYIRQITDSDYASEKFWNNEPDYKTYKFTDLVEWCGLDMTEEEGKKKWWWILRKNFTPKQKIYFMRLLKRYGTDQLNKEPSIIIDTIHSVKGGEADHVVIHSKTDYASDFRRKNKTEKNDENRDYYTGATRAKRKLHLLASDDRYNYPLGEKYLTYLMEEPNDK